MKKSILYKIFVVAFCTIQVGLIGFSVWWAIDYSRGYKMLETQLEQLLELKKQPTETDEELQEKLDAVRKELQARLDAMKEEVSIPDIVTSVDLIEQVYSAALASNVTVRKITLGESDVSKNGQKAITINIAAVIPNTETYLNFIKRLENGEVPGSAKMEKLVIVQDVTPFNIAVEYYTVRGVSKP